MQGLRKNLEIGGGGGQVKKRGHSKTMQMTDNNKYWPQIMPIL